jgi:hypothetical protein
MVVVVAAGTVVVVVPLTDVGAVDVEVAGAVVDVAGTTIVVDLFEAVVGVVGSVGGAVIGPKEDWPATATGTWTGIPTARSATRPTAWEATPTARAVASNQAAPRPKRFFITRRLSARPG